MTRKDFVLIARVLAGSRPTSPMPGQDISEMQWRVTVEDMADALAETNARFNLGRFLDACDYPKDGWKREEVS